MEKIQFSYSYDQAVARIRLNDGKGNILDQVMMAELQELLDTIRENKGLKLILFEGAGKHFSFGASVEEHQKEAAHQMLTSFHRLFYTLIDLGIPAVCKVSGQCLGGGMELALACNFIFADRTAKFGQPEIALGVFPPPASVILPLKIGLAPAEDLLLTGKIITAQEAFELKIVNEVFDDRETLDRSVGEWIEKHILPKSASSLRYAVKAVRNSYNETLKTKLAELQDLYVDELMETADANEGIQSFLEKRSPVWSNA